MTGAAAARQQAGRPLAAAVVVAATLALAACGGGDTSGSGTSASPSGRRLTKQQFIRRADQTCGKYNDRNSALRLQAPRSDPTAPGAPQSARDRAASVYRRFATNVRSMESELGRLSPPEAVDSQWQDSLQRMQDFSDAVDDIADATQKNDRTALSTSSTRALNSSITNDPFFTRYGFRVCGSTGG